MLLWSNSVWKQYNTPYTLTLSNMLSEIFSWVGKENQGKKVFNFFAYLKGGVVARMATGYTMLHTVKLCETDIKWMI